MTGEYYSRPDPDEFGQVSLRFDLRYGSIKAQIASAEEILKKELARLKISTDGEFAQDQTTGAQHRNFPVYLRAFDANLVGANRSEFGKRLFPERSSDPLKAAVHRAITEGNKLVNGGYKELFRLQRCEN